jgi:hydroxyethylthiazole kinase-like uncharacterized protein yjeF
MARADARLIGLDDEFVAGLLPRRDADGHKGTFGTLVCIAGSLDYAGAGLLCAMSAARGGAGLVALAVPRSLQPIFAGRVPEVITIALPETETGGDVDPAAAGHVLKGPSPDALVVGPGLRESEGYRALLLGLLDRDGPPMVVDGGALNLLSRSGEWSTTVRRACVLTPHPGEFARLTGVPVGTADVERVERCAAAADRFGQVVVLKGARTVICSADGRRARSPFANAALATAGSGDVLAGLTGAFLAQGVAPFEAACLGVFLHGAAGQRISQRLGDAGLLSSDLPYEIAIVRHDLAARRGGEAK